MVNLASGEDAGWAILKDIFGKTQFLLIPTRRLAGIESPRGWNIGAAKLLARGVVRPATWFPSAPNKELPRDAIGMAINAANARTQDQLHIHVDCIRPDVREALWNQSSKITAQWAYLDLGGHTYRRCDALTALNQNPILSPCSPRTRAHCGTRWARRRWR